MSTLAEKKLTKLGLPYRSLSGVASVVVTVGVVGCGGWAGTALNTLRA